MALVGNYSMHTSMLHRKRERERERERESETDRDRERDRERETRLVPSHTKAYRSDQS